MPKDQDLEVLRPVVTASTDQQARERTHDEGQEEQHRGMVGEPPVRCESRFRTPSPGLVAGALLGRAWHRVSTHEAPVTHEPALGGTYVPSVGGQPRAGHRPRADHAALVSRFARPAVRKRVMKVLEPPKLSQTRERSPPASP
jgi:hypothetical protein